MELSKLSCTLGRKLLKKSLQYTVVVDFTLGDPDVPTPDGISKAAIRAIKEHKTRYTAAGGIMPLSAKVPDEFDGLSNRKRAHWKRFNVLRNANSTYL